MKVGAISVTPYFTPGVNEYEDAETAIVKALQKAKKVRIAAMLVGDAAAVSAMLDRLLHHGHLLQCGPRSYRTKTDLPSGQKAR